jgi:predicted Zn finger-like uncharacterized protein
MQAACTHCGTEHVLKESSFGGHDKVQFKCSKCGQTTILKVQRRVDATVVMSPLPSFARSDASSTNPNLPPPDPSLRLPADKKVVLSILSGPSKGTSHTLTKPRVVLGRKGADIPVEDPEISRHHCLLEVRETYVNLKDMNSTNGTFYEEERTRAAMLRDGSEFRIGVSLIRVNFQPK